MRKSFAVPGQTPRPALDAALERLEAQSKQGCGVCGRTDFDAVWHGGAFYEPDTGRCTPWMCGTCKKDYQKKERRHR